MSTDASTDPTTEPNFRMIDATIQHSGDHWVVVPNQPGPNVIVINATGHEVLRACDGTQNLTGICEHVAAAFNTTATEIHADVAAFLHEAAASGIVSSEP